MGLNLEPQIVKLMHEHKWTLGQAQKVAGEYRRFLQLVAKHPDEIIVPSVAVDEFWHHHILDTMKYVEDCNEIFGFFLHHFPYFGLRGAEDRKNLHKTWERSVELYRLEFGEEPELSAGEFSGAFALCGPGNCNDGKSSSTINSTTRPSLATLEA